MSSPNAPPLSDLPIPTKPGEHTSWRGLYGCGDTLALAQAVQARPGLFLVIAPDMQSVLRLEHELRFFLPDTLPVLQFPDWETLPYDVFSPLPEIVSQRIRTLALLPEVKRGVLVLTAATLMQRIAPRGHILARTFALTVGGRLSLETTRQRLEAVGYQCVSQVMEHAEFAIRGSIIDIYPMGSQTPYRIELFDEDIESIRTFDPESQRSLDKVDKIALYPAREFPFDEDSIKHFRRAYRAQFPDLPTGSGLYQDISKGIPAGGIEYYLPLFVEHTETLFDYLPDNATLVRHRDVDAAAAEFYEESLNRFALRKGNIDRPALPVEMLFLDPASLNQRLQGYAGIHIAESAVEPLGEAKSTLACRPLPELAIDPKQKQPAAALQNFLTEFDGKLLFVAETTGHREALLDSLGKLSIRPRVIERWNDFLATDNKLSLLVAPLDHGLWLTDPPLAIVTETQLSGDKVQQRRRRRKTMERDLSALMRNLEELEIGSPVVHQDHGVGRYLGLQRLNVGGMDAEFLALEYANNDKLYVPVSSLHLISRYSGSSEETAPLHKLGGEAWQKAKRRAMEKARDVAAELLDIYARREAKQGHAFQALTDDYAAFAAGFPFEETPDQENAILDVIKDMSSPRPMDRVVCGDVGFGKTEVAMRAAFIAAHNGRQVAVLVPTTLLAQQHYQNFRDRFADWPIRIEVMSRFVGKKQQDEFARAAAEGKVDILIGTHKLLQKDIQFKNLGLVIIDEEHRFGVAQKEHFKKLRSELDILTLTATPIPRTLNMALGGLRDISIIATPPPNRHAIQTFVSEWSDSLTQEAITREIKRGGQVYFLHNKVETIEKMVRELEALVPAARIQHAHGQMPERELERIMLDFYHQRFNVLVATTIIESGIDVPSANTILINRADQLGLAQLHQLRGRVGRSHHRAYAYLLVPSKKLMTADAIKRLEAIEASGELGAGFLISSHDMEIRGAGELLGGEQSGQIEEIGFTLYSELLERAVAALKSGKQPELDAPLDGGPEVDLRVPALIPDDYLPDVHARLVLYKRIASARSDEDLRALQVEMIDRFGLLPPATKNLFASTELKLRAEKLRARKIEVGDTGGHILFKPQPRIDPVQVIMLIQTQSSVYRMDGPEKIRFMQKFETPENKIEFVRELLEKLAEKDD
ncbi:transcription-repair coupling factor [Methylococcus sp. EFPC2]|uniref:transcription-repair coupling factor n=1 Tax=Methylococcus sp. EFPC2 TaxID=2812648 RepID=UPI0019682819|nr:transcription-repair coupling factor [Methylococcus sp. EFPC2]QSA98228.1 transcription-repair coupling factor [Methylococcus sp. EFPC2]